jgi:hypothetical protein
MAKEAQTERLGLRVAPSELKMLEALSEGAGLSMSNVIRQLVRREYAEKFGELPRPARKPRR